MDEIYDKLAERLVPTGAAMFSPSVKRLVCLAGPPGAGKSTLANEVVRRVNRLWPQKAASFDDEVKPPDVAIVLPMDGFHLYRSQFDEMEVDYNDRPNAELIIKSKTNADLLIRSINF